MGPPKLPRTQSRRIRLPLPLIASPHPEFFFPTVLPPSPSKVLPQPSTAIISRPTTRLDFSPRRFETWSERTRTEWTSLKRSLKKLWPSWIRRLRSWRGGKSRRREWRLRRLWNLVGGSRAFLFASYVEAYATLSIVSTIYGAVDENESSLDALKNKAKLHQIQRRLAPSSSGRFYPLSS